MQSKMVTRMSSMNFATSSSDEDQTAGNTPAAAIKTTTIDTGGAGASQKKVVGGSGRKENEQRNRKLQGSLIALQPEIRQQIGGNDIKLDLHGRKLQGLNDLQKMPELQPKQG